MAMQPEFRKTHMFLITAHEIWEAFLQTNSMIYMIAQIYKINWKNMQLNKEISVWLKTITLWGSMDGIRLLSTY